LQDGAKIEDFKYLSKGKVFPVPTLSITSLPEDEQTSKHGGGGRYNAILEFNEEQIKIVDEKEKVEKNENGKEKNMCMRKTKK
jgi:hypothetical protein